jgi:hypothetical protein
MIDWAAHEVSFKRLTRNGKIHTAKLIHQLVNTNIQNQLYFGTSPLCPCCLSAEETFSPNTCCPAPSAAAHRSSAFQLLLDDLKKVQTPQEILDAISHGQTLWRSHTATPARALTFGSLKAPDIVLTAAFTEQCHIIGWLHFLLGCMWSSALLHYRKQSQDQVIGTRWASFLVSAEWKFTRSIMGPQKSCVTWRNRRRNSAETGAEIARASSIPLSTISSGQQHSTPTTLLFIHFKDFTATFRHALRRYSMLVAVGCRSQINPTNPNRIST